MYCLIRGTSASYRCPAMARRQFNLCPWRRHLTNKGIGMRAISTKLSLDWPCVENEHMPKCATATNIMIDEIARVAQETTNTIPYVNALDFVVGEGLGTKYRKYCQDFYMRKGPPFHELVSQKELGLIDQRLANDISAVFAKSSNRPPQETLNLLRKRCHALHQYAR